MQKNAIITIAFSITMILIGAGFISLHFNLFTSSSDTTKTFFVEVQRFKWTFYDENENELGASVTVNQGDTVILKLYSSDVAHGLWIDGYSNGKLTVHYPNTYSEEYINSFGIGNGNETGKVLILGIIGSNAPGKAPLTTKENPVTVTFKADTPGRFNIRCAVTCGSFHPYMLGEIKVQPHAVFYLAIGIATIIGALGIIVGYRKYTQLERSTQSQTTARE